MDETDEFRPSVPLWTVLSGAAQVLDIDPGQAEAQAREILGNIPGQQQTLTLLVSAMRAQGNTDGARTVLQSLATEHPSLAAIHYELGMLLSELGERDASIQALSRVVELEPKHPTAWRTLGDELSAAGNTEAAAQAYARQLESSVMDLKMLENMAGLGLDQIEIAGTLVREFLNIYSTDVGALRTLGQIYMKVNRFDAAEAAFARALQLAPRFTAVRQDYLAALRLQSKSEEEIRQLDIFLAEEPDHLGYRHSKALALARAGKSQESTRYCEDILRDHPDEARIWLAYALALRAAGRTDDCIAAFRRSLELDAGLGEAWWGLADLKTFQFSAREIEAMRSALSRENMGDEDRSHLHFALGKALEDRKTYAESFQEYQRGNALQRARHPFDADDIAQNVQREKALFTQEYYRGHAGQGCRSAEPIFIVGLPRSGSTLVEQILSSHSQVEGGGELSALRDIARRLGPLNSPQESGQAGDGSPTLESLDLASLGEKYLELTRAARKLGRTHFTDKMPGNFHHLGLICAILPNARIIDVRRHPLACCFSNFKQLFASNVGPSNDLTDIGLYYRGYVELMAHFDAVLPGRICRVFYETLVLEPEAEIRRLLEHCGLPFEEACGRFYESERTVLTVSSEQVKLPIYGDSVEHWRHFDRWLGPLKSALGPVLDSYPAVPATF
ncbi:MAG: sulfotransferase [Rhizomicrobium sp.]|jgi:tetratricopeptide (TPR) repeat protein